MTKRKKQGRTKSLKPSPPLAKEAQGLLPPRWRWLGDSRFLVPLGLYLVMLFVWRANVFDGLALNVTADRVSAISLRRIVAMWLDQGIFPFWNPYFYGGMSMFSSFQSSWLLNPMLWIAEGPFPDPSQPGFFNGGLGWLLFFGSPVDFILLHQLIGAIGVAFLVRHFGGKGWAQFIAGLLFLLSPQLVVLGDVGHGSKLFAMCWLPWLLLALDRALERPTLGRTAVLGAAFTMLMATQHIQVAYYGYMLAGFWWLIRTGRNVARSDWKLIPAETGSVVAGGLLGFGATAVIYLNTLTYSHDTIRGALGVTWDYATSWSFHPWESLGMFIPDWFGFGGKTYWGYLPFTDMPLYWGIPAAVLALIALIYVRDWRVRALFAAGVLAWITSFGKFGPVLYRLFYDYLPYFNKFRVPMMIHIIVLLAAVVLAGIGFQRVLDVRSEPEDKRKRWRGLLGWAAALTGGALLIALLLQGTVTSFAADWVIALRNTNVTVAETLGARSADSLVRSLLFAFLTLAVLRFVVGERIPLVLGGVLLSVLVLADLVPLAGRLLHPNPVSRIDNFFRADDAVRALQKAPRGRLLPLDSSRPQNTWAAFGIEIQGGYTGSKPATYGFLEERQALTNPNVLAVMNVRYFYSRRAISGLQPLFENKDAHVYLNPSTLPRTYLMSKWETITDTEDALNRLLEESFNPRETVIINREPQGLVQTDTSPGSAEVKSWNPNEVTVDARSGWPSILVLADSYTGSGWTAEVNGESAEILRADGMMRAVVVPAGESEVVFRYRPAHWTLSLVITFISLAVMTGIALLEYFRRRKRLADLKARKNVVNMMNPKVNRILGTP